MSKVEKTMLAAQAFAPGEVRCVEVAVPTPGDGDLLVRTEVASICGSDLHMAGMGWGIREWPAPPGHPGHEGAGVVVESRSPHYEPGDRVLTAPAIWDARCFAQYQSIDDAHVTSLPDDVPFGQATIAQQLGTVIYAARRLRDVDGAACVVVGQGSAGLFWDFLLKRLGAATVVAVEPVAHRRMLSAAYGAGHAVDPSGESAFEAVMELTGGMGADIVIESVGKAETLNSVFDLVRIEGQVVLFGLPETDDGVPFNYGTVFRKRVVAHTVFGSQDEPGQPCYVQALDWIARGEIDVTPVTSHTVPIGQVDRALQMAGAREDGVVKVGLSF